jgi:hypothetical protein
MNFESAWDRAKKIAGWLSPREALALYEAATKADGDIVEVGSYCGRSTTVLAATGKPVTSIEPQSTIKEVAEKLPNVTWEQTRSDEYSWKGNGAGMVFIDGDHVGDQPARDIRNALKVLSDNGIIVCHDYGSEPDVTKAVDDAVKNGLVHETFQLPPNSCGGIWVGKVGPGPDMQLPKVFLARPNNGMVKQESELSAEYATPAGYANLLIGRSPASSLLCWNFNCNVAECRNQSCDYFAMLHGDVEANAGWIAILIDDMNEIGADIIHAPCAIKDQRGLTSTARTDISTTGYKIRKFSIADFHHLPQVFTSENIDSPILLPNTGCFVMRCTPWFNEKWTGFRTIDSLIQAGETEGGQSRQWRGHVISEDWMLGLDAYHAGVKVACSKNVRTVHYDLLETPPKAYECDLK